MGRKSKVAILSVLVGVMSAASFLGGLSVARPPAETASRSSVSRSEAVPAFARERRPADVAPGAEDLGSQGVEPNDSRMVGQVVSGRKYWVVPGETDVCVVADHGRGVSGGCHPAELLESIEPLLAAGTDGDQAIVSGVLAVQARDVTVVLRNGTSVPVARRESVFEATTPLDNPPARFHWTLPNGLRRVIELVPVGATDPFAVTVPMVRPPTPSGAP
jgi:hypothetical protein